MMAKVEPTSDRSSPAPPACPLHSRGDGSCSSLAYTSVWLYVQTALCISCRGQNVGAAYIDGETDILFVMSDTLDPSGQFDVATLRTYLYALRQG